MARTGLVRAVCTVAMFAAAPAFAQTNMPTGDTTAGGAASNPTAHDTMRNRTMAPAERMGSPRGAMDSQSMMDHHNAHHAAMAHHSDAMNDRNGASEEAAVARLNDQSFQAARSGQAFNGSGAMAPSGSGSMNDMQGGSMSGSGPAGERGKM